jgi:nucleoside-diphosphate-sugar epimerase
MAKPKKTHQINVIGTRNVIQACEQAKITRLIVASSAAVYGSETKMPLSEDQAGACLSPYAESKWKNESQVVSARKRGMDAVALRFFNVYGPNQSTDGPYAAVVTNFIQQMCDGKRPTIYGDGGHSRDFIHASDLAEAILRFLIIPGADISHHVYNVSTGVAHSISSLVEEINQSLRKCNNQHIEIIPKFEPPRKGDILHSEGAILRLKACLDWSPAIPFSHGIEELVKLELKKGS